MMMQRLLFPKAVVTTFLFVAFMYGSAHAQESTQLPPAPPTASQNSENAIVLLSRVQEIVEEAMSDKPKTKVERPLGTSGTLRKSGQVMIDRADLDEIRANVEQLKIELQTHRPTQSAQPVLPTK
jgi:hypothetical protein